MTSETPEMVMRGDPEGSVDQSLRTPVKGCDNSSVLEWKESKFRHTFNLAVLAIEFEWNFL